jgi:hypothetical protein
MTDYIVRGRDVFCITHKPSMDLEDELPTPSVESRTSATKKLKTRTSSMLKKDFVSISEPVLNHIDEDQIPGTFVVDQIFPSRKKLKVSW